MSNFLSEIRLHGIRGIENLKIALDYPVSVIAGGNASGKSTVLLVAACAYKIPGLKSKSCTPATFFPNYMSKQSRWSDEQEVAILDYEYVTPNGGRSMRWRRKKVWTRSFLRRGTTSQPQREVYFRPPGNFSCPPEMQNILNEPYLKSATQEKLLSAAQISFAQQMLPFNYDEIVRLSRKDGYLLFANNKSGTSYSELHMGAGERAILRIAQAVFQLKDALILIDEVESGLHPLAQQLLMLQLQQLALHNDLQIIVTSHSPVVIDSVPVNARIFLEHDDQGKVQTHLSYRDIIQNALYGRSDKTLNILCEDEAAESFLQGILDSLSLNQKIFREFFRVGRTAGFQEFPDHAETFRKLGLIDNFIFILGGNHRQDNKRTAEKTRSAAGNQKTPVFFLPGEHSLEVWVWECLKSRPDFWAQYLNVDSNTLAKMINKLNFAYDVSSDTKSNIAKTKMKNLAKDFNLDASNIFRTLARWESERKGGEITSLAEELKNTFLLWREN